MTDKPSTAAGYSNDQLNIVRGTCLYIATKCGDFIQDIVIVGGLVPPLLINQESLPKGAEPHAGTMDVDVGLAVGLLGEERYRKLTEALRAAGFEPDLKDDKKIRQRWKLELKGGKGKVTMDFLISPTSGTEKGGTLKNIEADFAAIVTPGLHLAFLDKEVVRVTGKTILDEEATRDITVCGPGAFVVLKALAFHVRGENKDAYDLYYVVRNYGNGPKDVAVRLKTLLQDEQAKKALGIISSDFKNNGSVGVKRAGAFLGQEDEAFLTDIAGFFDELVKACA